MSAMKGDFIGFTFNGYHSSELGIIRVSDGNRYSENLLPTMQDKTVQIPGTDGTYFLNSFYTQRPINFSIAFDALTEEQLQKLKIIFGDRGIHDLIFDEVPYKVYKVKSTGTPNLKYIAFDKEREDWERDIALDRNVNDKNQLYGSGARATNGRIYKGEGQLNFVCYTPFARSRFKYIDEYTVANIPEWGSMDTASAEDVHYNLYDWVDSAGLKLSNATLNGKTIDKVDSTGVVYYNPGHMPVNFTLKFIYNLTSPIEFNGIRIQDSQNEDSFLEINNFTLANGDFGFQINGKLNLIEGLNAAGTPTGTIYNQYIESGDFFKLPVTSELSRLNFSGITPSGASESNTVNVGNAEIIYNYLYY